MDNRIPGAKSLLRPLNAFRFEEAREPGTTRVKTDCHYRITSITTSDVRVRMGGKDIKNKMPMKRFNEEVVTAAILGFEEQKRKINSQIEELRAMLAPPAEGITATPRRKGRVSAAARRAMAEAQRRRWAAVRAAKK